MKAFPAIIIPCHNEAACIGMTLDELLAVIPKEIPIAVGLNACTDDTGGIARDRGVHVGETGELGYGHGCLAAILALQEAGIEVSSYLFLAGDGANRPEDALRMIQRFQDFPRDRFLIGIREFELASWLGEFGRALPNLLLGVWCRILGGQFFHDLGPLRLIERKLFEEISPRELTWGWTIEAQIRASQLGVAIVSIPVVERERLAGDQKVSGVSLLRSLRIGGAIAAAGWRVAKTKSAP